MNKKCFYGFSYRAYPVHATLIEKKIKFSSHMRKFRMEPLQRHIGDTGGKFATGINNTSKTSRCRWYRWQFCRQCRWHRWQICHLCRWYWWCTLTCEYLREFSKKIETVPMRYSGEGGELIHGKKTKSKKSSDTVPLTVPPCSSQRLPVLSFLVYCNKTLDLVIMSFINKFLSLVSYMSCCQ